MRKTILLLIGTVFLNVQLWSIGSAVVKGKVENATAKEITFQSYGLPFTSKNLQKVAVNEDGTYEAKLDVPIESYYILWYNKRKTTIVYLSPKDDLTINFDARNLPRSFSFDGKGSIINNYLLEKYQVENNREVYDNTYFSMPSEEFLKSSKDYRTLIKTPLEKFKATHGKDKKFKRFIELEETDVFYKWATLVTRYAPNYAHGAKKDAKVVWENFDQSVFKQFDLGNEKMLFSKTYRDFLNHYLIVFTDKSLIGQTGIESMTRLLFTQMMYENIPTFFKNETIQNYMRTRVIYEYAFGNGINGMEDAISDFKQTVRHPDYNRIVNLITDKWQHLGTGQSAPDFEGVNPEGKTVKLSDFKGKIVYIDVWATWCGPCRKQIPYLEKLEEKYHGQAVEFMSVSIDRSQVKWEKWMAEKSPKGTQIFMPGGWGADICKKYNITGIPRFILIDKEGKIINVSADRPSGGIDGILSKLLAKG